MTLKGQSAAGGFDENMWEVLSLNILSVKKLQGQDV